VSSGTELVLLRLGLIGIIFAFVFVVAQTMRSGLRLAAGSPHRQSEAHRGPRLVLVFPGETGLLSGAEFPVAGVMSLGRDRTNGIVLPDPSVSTRHAELERLRDGWRLTDLGSTNGTSVNGRPVDGRGVALRGGEQLAFGTVVVRFQI
jgi:Inner membrane component of T3SS, cytoplasmic domain